MRIEEAVDQNIIAESFKTHDNAEEGNYDLVIASGGFVAHHPDKDRLKQIIAEALHLSSRTSIAIDKSFILPHLGVLSQVNETLALSLFEENVTIL